MKWPVGALALILVGALATVPAATGATQATPETTAEEEYLVNAADFVAAANWDEQQEVVVELSEFSFTPSDLTFQAGLPYVLTIRNGGKEKHYFTAHAFYRAIATRKAESDQSEVKVPYFTAIEVFPGKEVELYFVPVLPGTYELFCEIEGHAEAGMRGTITVTGEPPSEPAPVVAKVAEGDWVRDATERVGAATWDEMETVTIELGEFFFKPSEITLQIDRPYKLEIKNGGAEKHEFTADAFYRSVAFRKAQDASGEYKGPYPKEIEVFAGQQTDLYLIPTQVGEYELVCEIEGHKEAGMVGTIVVVSGS
jgi:uncharacterized cupredoxin-like copper-binding protein